MERAVPRCRGHGDGERTDPTGSDRLDDRGRVRGECRGAGVALAGRSAHDRADAGGQRHLSDGDGVLDAVSDRGHGRKTFALSPACRWMSFSATRGRFPSISGSLLGRRRCSPQAPPCAPSPGTPGSRIARPTRLCAGSAGADRARFCCRLAALSFRLALSVGLVPLPSLGPPSALSPVWRVALLRGFALPCPGGPVPDDQVAHVGDDEVGRSPLSCHDVIRTRSPSDTVESRRRLWSSGVEACRSPRSPGAFGPPITRPPRL